jgi:1-phosphofructokinase family hexose kinase
MFAVICLHPAIDRTLELNSALEVGGLNRAARVFERPGGKGVNVASVLTSLGAEACVILPVAGSNGLKLEQLLQKQNILGFKLIVAGETRECQAILDGSQTTEINESGPNLEASDLLKLEALIPEQASTVVLSGSLAPGLSVLEFGALVKRLSAVYQVVVDTSGEALKVALENGAYLIKPNETELEQLGLTCQEIFEQFGTRVLYSKGANGLEYLGSEGNFFQASSQIEVVNPVGAGDATLGGFLFGLARGRSIQDALRFANACGAAACLEPTAGMVKLEHIESILGVVHA